MTSDHNKSKISDEAAWIEEMARRGEPEGYDDIRDRFIIFGKNSEIFDHTEFAKWLMRESGEYFATMVDSDAVYYYNDGIYVAGGEAKINHIVEDVMDGHLMTVKNRSEVVGHIRALTRTDREQFDHDTDIVNMENGLYRISDCSFEHHSPRYLSLSKMAVKYDPDATCPVIDAFVADVVKPERVEAVYEIAGYSIMPRKKLKRGIIFVGPPDTGKSTMISLLGTFVGESRVSDVSPITIGNEAHASFDLFGMLMNRIDDLGNTAIIETGILKSIMSSKPIRANQKYGKPFTFVPNVLVLFGCNQVPICTDKNMMDKFDIFMFENTHEGEGIDLDLDVKLTSDEEMSGLFNKAMVAVHVALKNKTFTGSFTLDDRQKIYEFMSNPIARFVDECCDMTNTEATLEKSIFRKAYIEWSRRNELTIVTVGKQTTYLQDNGVLLRRLGTRDDRVEYYVGIDFSYPCHNKTKACHSEKPTVFQDEEADPTIGVMCLRPILPPLDKLDNTIERVEWGHDTRHQNAKQSTDSEKPLVFDHDTTCHSYDTAQNQVKKIYDDDTDSKLKHAVGKAIAKSDTMGAEISMIVECYPGNITSTEIREMLEERGKSLGINERYGKWYV